MEKTARKPSADPAQERLRQNKAVWNKEVSSFINDLIHFKKMMNGWPSKFFKERSRITQPIPADPATIIGSLAGDFQELAQKGNGLIQQQLDYAKNRRQKQPKAPTPAQPQQPTPEAPTTPPAAAPDLTQQLQKGIAASETLGLIKLGADFEGKYFLESEASNPFTRFITKLFTPKFGFGEGARIRRLRMTMLESCVKTLRVLKQLHQEIVKSGKGSIVNSHKIMTSAWNYWNIVNRLFMAYKVVKPGKVVEQGGQIEDPDVKRERELEEGREPSGDVPETTEVPTSNLETKLQDFRNTAPTIGAISKNPQFGQFASALERLMAMPKSKKLTPKLVSDLETAYNIALMATNQELGTKGNSFQEVLQQYQNKVGSSVKEAQMRELRKIRHQILPGATSGSRLEVYDQIETIRKNLDIVMDLLESGFDQNRLTPAINEVNRGMTVLRTMIRSLYYAEKPEEAPPAFF